MITSVVGAGLAGVLAGSPAVASATTPGPADAAAGMRQTHQAHIQGGPGMQRMHAAHMDGASHDGC